MENQPVRIRKARVFTCWCKSMPALLGEASAGVWGCWGLQRAQLWDAAVLGRDRQAASGIRAQSRAAPLPVSRVEFLGYGGPFVRGSAVETLPIFRLADSVLCEEKADGERCVLLRPR